MSSASEIVLTLPDGAERSVPAGTTALDVARTIGPRLADAAIGAELNGRPVDLRLPLREGGAFRLFTSKNAEAGDFVRHSAEHVLADAVTRLWPGSLYDAGRKDHSEKFQYDFRFERAFTPEDLVAIEAKMLEIVAEDATFERVEVSREEAEQIFRERGNDLKIERLKDIPAGDTITLYRHGRFLDLCRGPHVQRASQIGAVKLLESSGVYFKGDEKNEKLQRIYGTAYSTKKEMEEHEKAAEEARARDHRRLGVELDLFSFSPSAPASPFFHPKGAVVYNGLVDYVREMYAAKGYGEVVTPQILDVELWHKSGHYANYRENMFFTEVDERQFAVKPMNCPTHCLIFGTRKRSYRELPIRYADFGRLHRYERSGVTSGLTRVRSFAQDDGHIFCTEEQIGAEVHALIETYFAVYRTFGFEEVRVSFSTRPAKAIGSDELWAHAENALEQALVANLGPASEGGFVVNPGDGAFYGPKIDFQLKDAIGRWWQLGTIQLDYQMPLRFELEYIAPEGSAKPPVMIHRAMLGSLERFLGILIEHTAGAFPLWLAPVQVKVLPVSEKVLDYSREVEAALRAEGLRTELDESAEKLGYKIRQAQLEKVPVMLVIGGKEAEARAVALRLKSGEDLGALPLGETVSRIARQSRERLPALPEA